MACLFSSTSFPKFILILLLAISFYINSSTAARNFSPKTNTEFIRSSCTITTYPRLCFTSLSIHANAIQGSPKLMANAALNVTLSSAESTSAMMSKLSRGTGLKPKEVAAMRDCVEELSDSVYELRRSIDEMGEAKESNFELMINDVKTWVSAALTDDSACGDGFAGNAMNGNVKNAVREEIVKIAHLTSNALALVNNYASLHG